MDASKENCQKALEFYNQLISRCIFPSPENVDFMRNFLAAAQKRLPTQATIDKDKERKKKKDPIQEAAERGFSS